MAHKLADAARRYARLGWSVLPLHTIRDDICSCGEADCRSSGKHPMTMGGVYDATTELKVIDGWWQATPDANIGLTGLVVVDIDPRNGGSLEQLRTLLGGEIPKTVTVITGGGGYHLYYGDDGQAHPGKLANGIDIKGRGGYVVAPPSIHASGKRYEFAKKLGPDHVPIAIAPEFAKLATDEPTNGKLPDAVKAALESSDHLRDLYRGEGKSRGDTTQSGYDFSFTTALVRAGVTEYADLLAALFARPDGGARKKGKRYARRTIRRALSAVDQDHGARPRIVVSVADPLGVVGQAIEALAQADDIYQRGGFLVEISNEVPAPRGIKRDPDAPRARVVSSERLRVLLGDAAAWFKRDGRKKDSELTPTLPPAWVTSATFGAPAWPGVPSLTAVLEGPCMRADGSILATPGWDEATGLFVTSCPPITLTPVATPEEALGPIATITRPVNDFPFRKPAHLSAWIASLLTPLARFAYQGPTPLFLYDANVSGAGKTLLADLVGLITTGRTLPRSDWPGRDEETSKRITAVAMAGEVLYLWDNIDRPLGGGPLEGAITATSWRGRVLGQSREETMPLEVIWYATANNCTLKGDVVRRILPIRLQSTHERPEERADFELANVREWTMRHRGDILGAALSLLHGWHKAGRPEPTGTAWGSFEAWSSVVRGVIAWAGLPDPVVGRRELEDKSDVTRGLLSTLFECWPKTAQGEPRPMTSKEAAELAQSDGLPESEDIWASALEELAWSLNARGVGNALRPHAGRIVEGKQLVIQEKRSRIRYWSVVTL